MFRRHSLALLTALLSTACSTAPESAPEVNGSSAHSEMRVVDGSEEWESALSAYDGTDHARRWVEPILEAVPTLRYACERDFRASHGPFGGEALIDPVAAAVRYSVYWDGCGVDPAQIDHEDAARFGKGVDELAFYALYDDAGHLTQLIETDIWLSGQVELENRVEWSGDRPTRCEWLSPYDGGWRTEQFAWDDSGRLLRIISESDNETPRTTHFEYLSGCLRGIRVQVGGEIREETVVERGPDRRIRRMNWASFDTDPHPLERLRTVHYHYPGPGQVQCITANRERWSGMHWMRSAAGVEKTCRFNSGSADGVDGLWLVRTEYRDEVRYVERGFVALNSPPVPSKGVDTSLLFDSPLATREVRPTGLFWPERQAGNAHSFGDDFVIERDERGNWLKVGYIDPETGKTEVQYARTVEYL